MATTKKALPQGAHPPVHKTNAAARQTGRADPNNNPHTHYMNNQAGLEQKAADCHRRGRA